jgi:hypothetical protein
LIDTIKRHYLVNLISMHPTIQKQSILLKLNKNK